ncbi:hypothetical protein CR513_56063, partial [Mucuna pruriens]
MAEYNIFEAMKHPTKSHLVFYLVVIDQLGDNYINLHFEFPNFDDFTNCDCICTGLNECPICAKINVAINSGVRVVDIVGMDIVGVDIVGVVEIVAVQPPLPSIVHPLKLLVIIANKLQVVQKERLLQNLKRLGGFHEHLVKHSTLRFLLKKPIKDFLTLFSGFLGCSLAKWTYLSLNPLLTTFEPI